LNLHNSPCLFQPENCQGAVLIEPAALHGLAVPEDGRLSHKLGVGQGRSVAVVDTPAALEAARAAGVPALAFPGRLTQAEPDAFGGDALNHALSPEALISAWRGARNEAAE
jgi:hypothetical protein